MRKFLVKIVVFALTFFLIEKIFYVFLIIAPTLTKDNRIENVLKGKINKDVIVLGSSRGARNIIASQIEDSLMISSYNLSYPGSDIEFQEFLLRSVIKYNKTPKIVLLAVNDPIELLPTKVINFRYDLLYPLAKYDYINDEMIKRGEKTFLSKYVVLARMNKRNFDLRKKKVSGSDIVKSCGSMPISFPRKNRVYSYKSQNVKYNISDELPNKVQSFLRFQKLCASHKIKLFLIFPPNFYKHNSQFEKRLRQLSNPDVSFYVFDSLNKIYKDKAYFFDERHLQTKGAVIFTNEIIEELRKYVKDKRTIK